MTGDLREREHCFEKCPVNIWQFMLSNRDNMVTLVVVSPFVLRKFQDCVVEWDGRGNGVTLTL